MDSRTTLEDLKAAIRQLDEELREIEGLRQSMLVVVDYFEGRGRETRSDRGSQSSPLQRAEHFFSGIRRRVDAPRRQSGSELRNAIAAMLAQEGPLHRKQIHDRLVEMGVSIGGRDSMSSMGAHLSNDSRFRPIGDGIWGLVDAPEEATDMESGAAEKPADSEFGPDDGDLDSGEEDSVPW